METNIFSGAPIANAYRSRPRAFEWAACLLLALTLSASAADQYPPGRLTFQGHLTDAAGVPLGQTATTNAQVQFRLWRSATGTAPADLVWAEKQTVKVTRGFFNTLLGSGTATGVAGEFFTNNLAGLFLGPDASDRYLGVTVVGQGAEIAPRMQFLSSPFAHLARTTANLLNQSGQPVFNTAPGAVGINVVGAPGVALDVVGTVKANTFTGDGSGLTGVPVLAANVTGTFDATRLADGVITGAKFATNTIAASQLTTGAVTAQKLSPDAALAVATAAGGVPNGTVIISSNRVDPVLHNMGYVNVGRANFEGAKWTVRATKDTPNAPAGRMFTVGSTDHRASASLWTGSKWIIWSGFNIAQNAYLTDGAVFDPAVNSWTPISTVGAPVARNEINFLWTGTKGLVWGGHNGAHLANGGIYDPNANTWSPMSTVNQPSVRCRQRNVWTGTEMFVWGGETSGAVPVGDGKLYNPATDTWRNVSASPLSARRDFNAFWTGSEVLVWGGEIGGNVPVGNGALYNPATDTWRLMSTNNAPTAREWGQAVWTGKEFIVWGGVGTTPLANADGGRYDLATDTWIPFKTPNLEFIYEGAAFWSGAKVYFLQGRYNAAYVNEHGGGFYSGWSFDPSNNKWDYQPRAPIAQTLMPHVWTGSELLTFATFRDGNDRTVLSFKPESETYFYSKTTPAPDNWTIRATAATPNAPLPRFNAYSGTPQRSVWTGSKWLVWGLETPLPNNYPLNSGAAFDPANNSWQTMSPTNAPSPRFVFSVVWTGDQAIYWGGYSNNFIGDGKRYFAANNTWSNITATGAPSARARHSAVWTGTEMLVWGGAVVTGTTTTNNGARYNPATDTWTAMAAVPVGFTNRADHLAVWTGTEMLVWGGTTNSSSLGTPRSDGARYNPTSNTWTPMSSVNAPTGRALPLGVWTGTELIVWGGYSTVTNSNDGGRYNPATDTWTPFNTGSYKWSVESTAVWTGSKVIWAGGANTVGLVNKTGVGGITYDPATGTVGTLPVAPVQQRSMPFAWTGTELLTFGSFEDALDRTVLSYRP